MPDLRVLAEATVECESCNGIGADMSFTFDPIAMPQGNDCPDCVEGRRPAFPLLRRECQCWCHTRTERASGQFCENICGFCLDNLWLPIEGDDDQLVGVLMQALHEAGYDVDTSWRQGLCYARVFDSTNHTTPQLEWFEAATPLEALVKAAEEMVRKVATA